MQIVKDTLQSVTNLVKEVKRIIRKAQGDNKIAWKGFLKDCRTFLREEKKRLARKWNALRFAANEAANLHEGLSKASTKEMKEVFRTILFANLEGYLLWIEKNFSKEERQDWGGNYNNFYGKYYEAKIGLKDITKIARWYTKNFLQGFKFKIRQRHYGSFQLEFDSTIKGAKEAAEKVKSFINQFNHDRSDAMTDYFDTRFYFFLIDDRGCTVG